MDEHESNTSTPPSKDYETGNPLVVRKLRSQELLMYGNILL